MPSGCEDFEGRTRNMCSVFARDEICERTRVINIGEGQVKPILLKAFNAYSLGTKEPLNLLNWVKLIGIQL